MSDDDKIKPLPVKFKAPPSGEISLKVVPEWGSDGCNHKHVWNGSQHVDVTYLIRDGETEIECGNCHVRLDPMFVLKRLAAKEMQWTRTRDAYVEEMKRLRARERTKCQHCGKLTRISR